MDTYYGVANKNEPGDIIDDKDFVTIKDVLEFLSNHPEVLAELKDELGIKGEPMKC